MATLYLSLSAAQKLWDAQTLDTQLYQHHLSQLPISYARENKLFSFKLSEDYLNIKSFSIGSTSYSLNTELAHHLPRNLSPRTLDGSPNSTTAMDSNEVASATHGFPTDVVVWEGQSSLFRVQLDPEMFIVAPSTTGNITSSAGPVTYYVKLDTSAPLPSWLKFDSSALEFTGVPPVGTYRQTTIITVVVEASTVPGFIQATSRFTIKVVVHSLALSTFPARPCSSTALFTSLGEDSSWQDHLPDLNLDPAQRVVNFEFSMDLFRVDECIQPARPDGVSSLNAINGSDTIHKSIERSVTTRQQNSLQTPLLTQLSIQLSAQTTQELMRPNNTLPEWLTFDSARWILAGVIPPAGPAVVVLDVQVVDSFKTYSTFKLQIFSQSPASFSFKKQVSDVWVKSGESFGIDLQLAEYLNGSSEAALNPIESRFTFEVIDLTDFSPNAQNTSNPSVVRITNHSHGPSENVSSNMNNANCTYYNLWRQESQGNGGKDLVANFPSWFSYNSSMTTTQPPLTDKVTLFGLIPCEVTLRVRWAVKSSQSQWTSTEFLVRATVSGPPFVSAKPHDPTLDAQHHGDLGLVGINIAVAFAAALPVVLALWFLVRRYCQKLKGDPAQKNAQLKGARDGDLELGWPPSRGSRGDMDSLNADLGYPRHGQLASGLASHRELEYRSSYEDDPSVGHRDSYSEKYVAENQPWTCSSENEGEGSESDRMSILGWLFGEKSPATTPAIEEPSMFSEQPPRRVNEDAATFSLKRISVGYPFESNRFGFINGSRISYYGCSPAGPSHASEIDDATVCVQVPESNMNEGTLRIPGVQALLGRNTSKRNKMAFGRGSTKVSKRGNGKNNKRRPRNSSNADLPPTKGKSENTNPSGRLTEPGTRVCHSSASAGTGYMASMSECNTSIDERQDSELDSEDIQERRNENMKAELVDQEEVAKARRRLSRSRLQADILDPDHEERISWTPILDLDVTGHGETKKSNIDISNEHKEKRRDLEHPANLERDGPMNQISRSDSGALMVGSTSTSLSNLRIFTNYDLSKDSAVLSRQPRASPSPVTRDRANSLSSYSVRVAPVMVTENIIIKDHQSSLQATTGSINRRSIVELLQSNDVPVSPLSAFSASLPYWNNTDDSTQRECGDGVSVIQNKDFVDDRVQSVETRSLDGEGYEKTKWMVVPCNQPLGIIEQAISESLGEYSMDGPSQPSTLLGQFQSRSDIVAISLPSIVHEDPRSSAFVHSQQGTIQHERVSRPYSNLAIARQSSEHIQPVPCLDLVAVTPFVTAVPRKLVKATIGTAFHYTSSVCGPNSGTLSTPNLQRSQHSRTSASSLPPMVCPTTLVGLRDEQATGEYRAYLVSGPQDRLQAHARTHRVSSSLSSLDSEQGELGSIPDSQSRRKLPDWIQFNRKLCSIWGRPTPGTAGEWQVSLVQSRPAPTVEGGLPTIVSQSPPEGSSSSQSQNQPERPVESILALASGNIIAIDRSETNQESVVELVALLVREPIKTND
ncbi:hypothetical protein BGX26_006556 [Mortierella sp. AD094]|nr:hypothetical protein BGX26_006556 [Mortierella sp. AD094]